MKKQLLKKFSTFVIPIISGAMLFSASANAQIVYTDVIPDVIKRCTTVGAACSKEDSIDLNNDGIYDLKLMVSTSSGPLQSNPPPRRGYVRASPLHGSSIKTDTAGYPLAMNLNDAIDANGNWMTTPSQILIFRRSGFGTGPTVMGNWLSSSDRYLGIKLITASQTDYCWVRLTVGVAPLFDIVFAFIGLKDYAYNSIPNQPILAGQTTATGIIENSFASYINLFPNPATDKLTIALGSNNKKVEVTIADITGQIIYKTVATNSEKVEVNTQDIPAGIYLVQIQTADFIATKKLVIEK